ncbi:ABC transporter ATP-binding protein [Sanguibacter antarcticus]|uniref:ABC-2 type transport system ATP-binding protein n=1 Tax=Sanguibacter antarcticus TaxID=372484 RepID=A0A2A9E6C1_9MICO|nr:ABC transporter ATP-binding protein [Sanguibacter antarcticus]PFG34196.1 ABC-2 type transport system ATP-binding protein [Sanguibacter antarcticus]
MNQADAIRTSGLTKTFGDLAAVNGLDLEVRVGEIFGFLGPNGAGKSTTIRMLLDQIRATSGTAQVLGLDIRDGSLEIRRRIGYLPGDLALYPKLTGRQTLTYFARLRGGVSPAYVDELAERLGADLTRKVGEYSTGNRQKIGLIQAFMHKPELLVLDEPNAGLDPLVQQTFHEMLREVRDDGRTVFLSSHTLSEVERVADRVGIIRHGRLVVVERVDELKRTAVRRLDFEFAAPVPTDLFAQVEQVHDADIDGVHARVSYDGSVNPVLQAAMTHEVVNLSSRDADLEEIFLTYYRDTTTPEVAASTGADHVR